MHYNIFTILTNGVIILNIMVVGAGGIGGYLAGRLSSVCDNVTVVARGANLEAIIKDGITVIDSGERITSRPYKCVERPDEKQDVIVLSTKSYGLDDALTLIEPCVKDDTLIIPLLNGVNMHKRIIAKVNRGIALLGSIYVYSKIVSPGVIEKTGDILKVVLGEPNKTAAQAPAALGEFARLLTKSGIPTEISDDILRENWLKWSLLIASGQSNAYFDLPIGAIREDSKKLEFVLGLAREFMQVAKAEGINIPDNHEETILKNINSLAYESRSSFSRDIADCSKKTELSIFAGELCELADKHGISVPCNESVLNRFRDRL